MAERIHYLKTYVEFFQATKRGDKNFELRKNDRNYRVGDLLILMEYDPVIGFIGSEDIWVKVTYILSKQPYVPKWYVCMSTVKGYVHDGRSFRHDNA